ncbi:MAG: hypothetical protein BAJATHORv1_40127 [Candidatus Thorarchaeota archaeon]|nr:MAG: hypothetical protein BAJATHORv1_40127 [Candidatus Thorarchaeota archaeon]
MSERQIENEYPLFPILKGESVGESGEFSGRAIIVRTPKDLLREWDADHIVVLHHDLAEYFENNPGHLDNLFSSVHAVIAEFGESIGDFASFSYVREVIGIVKVQDATHVLENDMHIRVVAEENVGEIFFVD